jgi:DHA1 family bicyclomycin/chloramphenicol resistance-like MFS transporter
MLIGSVLYVAASFLVALAPNVEMFFASRFIQGVAGAAVLVVGNAVLRDLYDGLPLLKIMGRVLLIQALAWFIGPFAVYGLARRERDSGKLCNLDACHGYQVFA